MSAERAGPVHTRRLVAVVGLSIAVLAVDLLAMQATGAASSVSRRATTSVSTTSAATTPAGQSSAFHQTKTIERVNLINGKDVVVDQRTVSLSVSITNNLIDRQVINVSWSGAHPTGGIIADPNDGANAQFQEYPMVLLECHGNPSPSAPPAQQIQPQDCWTATPSERFFSASPDAPYPPWRIDRYATAAGQRNLTENEPNPLPAMCGLFPGPHYWLNYVTPQGTSYPIGPGGCAGMPNEMSLLGGLGILPSNETFAATHLNDIGSAAFDVWTNELNPELGCSQQVSCALIAVPVMGISCDPAAQSMPPADQPTAAEEPAAAALCEQTGYWPPGSFAPPGQAGDLSVTGQLWWAASNWRNRFVVPLHFAPPANICSIVNKGNRFVQVYGSELMDQAALQWQPHFCLNKNLFTLGYVQTPEQLAASQLAAGTVEAALVSNQPPTGFIKPVVHAPVSATGFAISFVMDNSVGVPVTTLRLDPRLLAKLLTESYPALLVIADEDPEILHSCPGVPVPGSTKCTNPLDITLDPEFQALNPGLPKGVAASAAASVLLMLSDNNDVTWALTSYINDNPAARAWLNGTPDPWGMTVNSRYRGIALPVSSWPLLSIFEPPDWLSGGNGTGPGPCYSSTPSPVLPLIAAPVPDLPTLAEDVQFYLQQSQLVCVGTPGTSDYHLAALGPQTVGYRFMIAVTTLADARRFELGTASLLTYTKPGTPAKFTSAAGMTFAPPTDSTLRNAVSLLVPDSNNHVWTFPYSLYQQDSAKAAQAYPGTMLVYADIPTTGLPAADAKDYAEFLTFAATAGQTPGGGIGQLAAGYLPMTAANHLGAEAAYTVSAAAAVAAQKGGIPALAATGNGGTTSPGGSGAGTTPGGSGPGSGTGSGSGGTGSTTGAHPKVSKKAGGNAVPLGSSSPVANVALTPGQNFGLAGYVLLGVAGLAVAAAVAAAVTAQVARSRGKKWRFTLFGRKIWG